MKILSILRLTTLVTFASLAVSLLILFLSQSIAGEKTETPPWAVLQPAPDPRPLPHTKPLIFPGDLSEKMIAGIDKFLLKQIAQAAKERPELWNRDLSSPE
ncbi:MAG TPA: hypothetical protein DCY03_20865, partial [Planctomycetaceae bacterium]|nr:hypothetical protein [Planctomycetaceae bacterium]